MVWSTVWKFLAWLKHPQPLPASSFPDIIFMFHLIFLALLRANYTNAYICLNVERSKKFVKNCSQFKWTAKPILVARLKQRALFTDLKYCYGPAFKNKVHPKNFKLLPDIP